MNYGMSPQDDKLGVDGNEKRSGGVAPTERISQETNMTDQTSKTAIVDLFLEKHGSVLPGHVVDFALDVRSAIAELEEQLTPVSV